MGIVFVLAAVLTGYTFMKFMLWKKRGICKCDSDLTGKTVIITGANSGIGYETAADLARRNARVIIACRSPDKGEQAVKQLIQDTGNTNICCHTVDMASFKSVKNFATMIRITEPRLDILINNAGVTGLPYRLSENKLEYTFHTNFVGPFLLTNLLLGLLKKSAPSRIVNVTSIAHKWGSIDFTNLNSERRFSTGKAYFNSKLAVVMFTRELARHLDATGVTVSSLHPGTVNTQLLRNLPFLLQKMFDVVGFLFFKDATEGAQTTIYCAIADEVVGLSGCYFSECRIATEAPAALDEHVTRKLWEVTERMVSLAEAEFEVENSVIHPRSRTSVGMNTIYTGETASGSGATPSVSHPVLHQVSVEIGGDRTERSANEVNAGVSEEDVHIASLVEGSVSHETLVSAQACAMDKVSHEKMDGAQACAVETNSFETTAL